MSSYAKTVEKMTGESFEIGRMLCDRCRSPTLLTMLGHYGGRCLPCFETYCEPGINGGMGGFVTGRKDNRLQASMRKRASAGRVANVLVAE